jgi:hypothetical protein
LHSLRVVQKKSLLDFQKKVSLYLYGLIRALRPLLILFSKQLAAMESQQIHIICLARPSEALKMVAYTSRGRSFEYFALLCKKGGSHEDFELNCRGESISDSSSAGVVVQDLAREKRAKNQLQIDVRKLLLNSISMCSNTL